MRRRNPIIIVTGSEVNNMFDLVSRLNPDNYSSPRTKSLIYKAKSTFDMYEGQVVTIRVVEG